jgi:hypothetical protein
MTNPKDNYPGPNNYNTIDYDGKQKSPNYGFGTE